MTLTLELSESAGVFPANARHVFGEEGGTIGRAPTNTWVIPQNKVSGLHARISFRNGVFYIEDTSRNGVCVNSLDNRLVRNRPYALKSGDRLLIEPYVARLAAASPDRAARSAVDSAAPARLRQAVQPASWEQAPRPDRKT